jgi:hypothetical protein
MWAALVSYYGIFWAIGHKAELLDGQLVHVPDYWGLLLLSSWLPFVGLGLRELAILPGKSVP